MSSLWERDPYLSLLLYYRQDNAAGERRQLLLCFSLPVALENYFNRMSRDKWFSLLRFLADFKITRIDLQILYGWRSVCGSVCGSVCVCTTYLAWNWLTQAEPLTAACTRKTGKHLRDSFQFRSVGTQLKQCSTNNWLVLRVGHVVVHKEETLPPHSDTIPLDLTFSSQWNTETLIQWQQQRAGEHATL